MERTFDRCGRHVATLIAKDVSCDWTGMGSARSSTTDLPNTKIVGREEGSDLPKQ